jgi:hypothetical protein
MVSLNATYLSDLGRVRLELVDPEPNVRYRIQRSTESEPAWVDVRGAQNMSTLSSTIVDDYEYTANEENRYRLIAPSFYDSFQRVFPIDGALSLDGISGSFASTPHSMSIVVSGDLDVRVATSPAQWIGGGIQTIAAMYTSVGGDFRSWQLVIQNDGIPRINASSDGLTAISAPADTAITTGSEIYLRFTLDVDNGGGNSETTFYTGTSITGPWTPLGAPVLRAIVDPLFTGGSEPLIIGGSNGGTNNMFTGLVHHLQVRDGINGTIVANPDFTAESAGTTSFNDSEGNTWTLSGNAEIIDVGPIPGFDWGTADTGQDWLVGVTSPGSSAWVDNGVGVIQSGASPAGTIHEMVTDLIPGAVDAELTWSAIHPGSTLDVLTEFNVGLRSTGFTDTYETQLLFEDDTGGTLGPARSVHIRLSKRVGGSFSTITAATQVGEWQPGIAWNVRSRVQGSSLLARAWQQGTDEPVNWQVAATDTDLTTGNAVHVRTNKGGGAQITSWFGPMELHTIPQVIADSAAVTPEQTEVFLKSIQYPLFNKLLECVDWQELTRESRVGFHNVKGRHEILGIADVGSSASFELTFITRSRAENRAVVALLTFGGLLLLQPPGEDDAEDCPVAFSGIPGGYVMPGESVQARTVYGQPIWQWTVFFTRVAPADASGIVPTTITWTQLWDLIGDEGTWEDVWATWPSWQSLWLTAGSPESFGEVQG